MNQPHSLAESLAAVGEDGARALQELALPADAAILDVGTGNGKFAIWLATQGFRVLTGEPATDTTHYAGRDWAANAEEAGVRNRIHFEHFDASDMPFEPGSFDAVFFFGVMHHVDESIRGDVFREALRVVKKDGSVVFFEPRKALLEKMWESDPGHPHAADPSDYLPDPNVQEQRIEGSRMDVFIYRPGR
jgi:SAM-dependent methyltransferase